MADAHVLMGAQPASPVPLHLPSLQRQAGPVIDAGGIFEFARKSGMIKAKA